MKSNASSYRTIISVIGIALLAGAITTSSRGDFLYVGDGYDNTVKRFDVDTGAWVPFVPSNSGGLDGPRGLIFIPSQHRLVVANQNVDQDFSGEILAYNGTNGMFREALVPHSNSPSPDTPWAPRGIVAQGILFVASFENRPPDDPENDDGSILMYTPSGKFIGELPKPQASSQLPAPLNSPGHFHPRSLVILDGLLYVSNAPNLPEQGNLQGEVLRYSLDNKAFKDVFVSDLQDDLQRAGVSFNRPEGLVFGPDGNLYITSFRTNMDDNDKILIFAGPHSTQKPPGSYLGKIDLDDKNEVISDPQKRALAQALLFGPNGLLFVPITGPGPLITGPPGTPFGYSTGAVRRYNVKRERVMPDFVLPFLQQGPLRQPWYLTFGKTDPATLAYPAQ
jgi:hypothetical protein